MNDNSYMPLPVIEASPVSPPAFKWDTWYAAAGGRTISIADANYWMGRIQTEQLPRFEGITAQVQQAFDSPQAASDYIKRRAKELGADIIGLCTVEPEDIYQQRSVPHKYAIVLGMAMSYKDFVTVPSEAAAVECLRIYHALGEVVISLAEDLRSLGHHCEIEHPIGDSSVLHIPLALKAGFGELGRHGSIIHPTFGPLFRIGSILMDIPVACDSPIDAGIGAFCDKCQACRVYCPADAIPDTRSELGTDPIGAKRYVVDTGKCFPYFAKRNYCSACLAVCAYKHKAWATMDDGTIGPYPAVPFGEVPHAVDVAEDDRHRYMPLRRNEPSPYHRKK